MRVTPVAEWGGGRRDLGAESGSRASGLVRTRRVRRHIPGNGGARPGAGWAGRGLGAGAEAGRGSVEFGGAGVGGRREARAFVGGGRGRWAGSVGRERGGPSWGRGRGPGGERGRLEVRDPGGL